MFDNYQEAKEQYAKGNRRAGDWNAAQTILYGTGLALMSNPTSFALGATIVTITAITDLVEYGLSYFW